MSRYVGIDLGTSNTVIHMKGRGIVLREPSVVVTDMSSKKILAVGDDAKKMIGKTPGGIVAQHPLKDGVIADFDMTYGMLHSFLKKIKAVSLISKPSAVICTPYSITEVERRAVEDVMYETGAKKVSLVDEPMAAAIGAGLDVTGSRGAMIVDIGGGTTEVAVISLGGIVCAQTVKVAGSAFDDAIVRYMKREHRIIIGESTAELLKKTIGSVHTSTDRGETEIRGLSERTGLPVVMTVTSAQIREAVAEPLSQIVGVIRRTLEITPPELSADIFDYGIMLTGGGALIGGLQQALNEKVKVRVTVAKKPLESVAVGIGRIIDRDMADLINMRNR